MSRAVAAAGFPPPVDSRSDFVKRTLDDAEECVDAGVAIIGGGPCGSGLTSFETAGAGRPTGARGWTNEQILAAIRAWCSLYDEVPCQADWDPHRARRIGQEWRIRRYRTGDWPSLKTVINRYGRLSDAIAQAGLAPRQTKSGRTDREAARYHAFAEPLDGASGEGHRRDRLARSVRAVAIAERSSAIDLRSALVTLAKEALAWADAIEERPSSPGSLSRLRAG